MINELYSLSEALANNQIKTAAIAREYLELPKVTKVKPLIRIFLEKDGRVRELESLLPDHAALLRKYGNNQGAFPAFNVSPLFRTTVEEAAGLFGRNRDRAQPLDLSLIASWCEHNNWSGKLATKLDRCMGTMARKLDAKISDSPDPHLCAVRALIRIMTVYGEQPSLGLHTQLREAVFRKLAEGQDIDHCLALLLHVGDPRKPASEDTGPGISVVLDIADWDLYGYPVASQETTAAINRALVATDQTAMETHENSCVDAFGMSGTSADTPMPKVKLALFDTALRTMYSAAVCQTRYGKIEAASYPLVHENRSRLQSALKWISSAEQRDITWVSVDKDEVVLVYPSKLAAVNPAYASILGASRGRSGGGEEARFKAKAEDFIQAFRGIPLKERPKDIEIFFLRKMDKARIKVVFSRNCAAEDYMQAADDWQAGCENLPAFRSLQPPVPFPLDVSAIVNRVWTQSGSGNSRVSRMKGYQGVELLLGDLNQDARDNLLSILVRNADGLVQYIGKAAARKERYVGDTVPSAARVLAVIALLLHKSGIRKESYMDDMAYLLGQTLKASDELHVLYCKVVRKGELPSQLVGGGLFAAACETPVSALSQLGQRMNPYITWARLYCARGEKDSKLAGWYLAACERLCNKLGPALTQAVRMDDYDRARLYIGYLASLPGKEKVSEDADTDTPTEEQGGTP